MYGHFFAMLSSLAMLFSPAALQAGPEGPMSYNTDDKYRDNSRSPSAWIDTQFTDDRVTFLSMAIWPDSSVLTYSLELSSKGQGGTTVNRQGGQVQTKPDEAVTLSSSTVNIGPDRMVSATLTVTGPDGQILTDTVDLSPEK